MTSTVNRNRPKFQVTECRRKIKRDKTPSRQNSTPDGEDSGVQLDDSSAFNCGFYGPETQIIALSGFDAYPEIVRQKEEDAMTVHSSDIWGQAPSCVAPTSLDVNRKSQDSNRKCEDRTRDERKSHSPENDKKSLGSDAERKLSDADRKSANADRRSSEPDRKLSNPEQNMKNVATVADQTPHCSDPNTSALNRKPRGSDGDRKMEAKDKLLALPPNPRRVSGSAVATEFFSGSDPNSEGESGEGISFLSAPETMPPKKPCRDTRNKMRFKKFFRPLRRSKSTGNAKETSSSSSTSSSGFSFFQKPKTDNDDRESVDTGCGSMEHVSDRETEETKEKEAINANRDKKKKSLTTEVKAKLHELRRRYTDLTMTSRDGKLEKPMPEAIKNWAKTIELLLADKFGLQCFHAFLKSEFSEENIDFWMACEAYKTLKTSKQPSQAQKIFAEYIAHQAPREINIDSVTREATCARMAQPDATTFDPAQKRIQALMDKDSYPRFIQSSLYQELVTGQSPLLS